MRQIFLDTETTGLSPTQGHRVVEIACIEVKDGIETGKRFHHYIDPQRDVPEEVVDIHGLTSEYLKGKPLFVDIAADLIEFITGADVLIHNAPFDLAFLDHEFRNAGIRTQLVDLCAKVTDTLPVFRSRFPGQRCSLKVLCERLKVELEDDEVWHTAMTDARCLARLWNASDRGEAHESR